MDKEGKVALQTEKKLKLRVTEARPSQLSVHPSESLHSSTAMLQCL